MKNPLNQNAIVPFKGTFIPKTGVDRRTGLRSGTTSVFWLIAAFLAITAALCAETTNTSTSSLKAGASKQPRSRIIARTGTASARPAAGQGDWTLVEVGADHKTWTLTPTNAQQNRHSSGVNRGGRRVVEIATGMNYFDRQNWIRSDPTFEVTVDGCTQLITAPASGVSDVAQLTFMWLAIRG